ncbi:MAG: K(+)-transporting ATPase subunit C [Acidimicrobiia bacterium]
MRRQLITGLTMTLTMIVLVGLAYPLAMTGIAQGLMKTKANGSYVSQNGKVVGSSLIGQNFLLKSGAPDPRYFQPRPSAAGTGYDAMASGGSNLGPSSNELISDVARRVNSYRKLNGLSATASVPVDAVTASASGLDPDISVANATLQAPRVAAARKLSVSFVLALVRAHTDNRPFGILGEKTVNVLDLNLALDRTS